MRPRQRIHGSWHIAAASGGVLLGSVAALLPQTRSFASAVWLVAAVLLLAIVLANRSRRFLVLAIVGGLLIGLWRGSGEQIQLATYKSYYNQQVTIRGSVAEDPTISSAGKQQLHLSDIQLNRNPMHGKIWVSMSAPGEIKRGDIVVANGRLSKGFGTFAASMYRAGITTILHPEPGDVGRRVRDWFAAKVRIAVAEPQASLGISYALGQSQTLSETISDEFRLLGLTHLLVASGSQLTLLVRLTRRPLSKRSKYLATAAALSMMGSFLLLTGLSPSMVRAALVSGLSLIAWYYGRNVHPAVLLLFAAGMTVLMQPSFIWGDVGWLLSFAAFGGIVLLAPLINDYFWGSEKEPGFIRYLLVSTIAAQLVTLPIALYTFGEYSPLSVIANMLILPLVSVAMLLTLLGGLAGALVPGVAAIAGWPAYALLHFMTTLTSKLASLPWAHGEVTFGVAILACSYAAICVLAVWLWRKTGHNFRQTNDIV